MYIILPFGVYCCIIMDFRKMVKDGYSYEVNVNENLQILYERKKS